MAGLDLPAVAAGPRVVLPEQPIAGRADPGDQAAAFAGTSPKILHATSTSQGDCDVTVRKNT
jgi:hypothetical protein